MGLKENIVLCGFMGCGKTASGILLARILEAGFIDMDEYIETREKMSVAEIFERFGEEGFRDCEHEAVLELSQKRGIILASGGGALIFQRNTRPLSGSGEIIFLNPGFDICYRRIKDSSRPLVVKNTREQLNRLHDEREASYRAACSIEIKSKGSPEEISRLILNQIKNKVF